MRPAREGGNAREVLRCPLVSVQLAQAAAVIFFLCALCEGRNARDFLQWPVVFLRLAQAAAVNLFNALCVRRGKCWRFFAMAPVIVCDWCRRPPSTFSMRPVCEGGTVREILQWPLVFCNWRRRPPSNFSTIPVCEGGNAGDFLKWPVVCKLLVQAAAVKLFHAPCAKGDMFAKI